MSDQGRFVPPPVQPQFGYAPVVEEMPGATKNDATTILILGILGLVVCQLCAPFAWKKGNTYAQVCTIHGIPQESTAVVGRVLGIVGTVLFVLSLLWLGFVFVMMFAAH